ncbi:hypothetical protein CEXT_170311 [Caerostris extrusa]|uniref:Uncharacterized protein n=1 Tax=Caerostris extrusa TaxID=172846 RepID=A0AAV4VTE4_CAEEX|nr:hypothetical protein CEXT_170311 [Caerostris extrusa]
MPPSNSKEKKEKEVDFILMKFRRGKSFHSRKETSKWERRNQEIKISPRMRENLRNFGEKECPVSKKKYSENGGLPQESLKMKVATIIQSGPSGRQCPKNGFHSTEKSFGGTFNQNIYFSYFIFITFLKFLCFL